MLKLFEAQECQDALNEAGVPTDEKLIQYMQALLSWNQKINLTGAKSSKELAFKHIADVWQALQILKKPKSHIFDVGSGAGLPGLPLAIMCPFIKATLIERRKNKAFVLMRIVSELALQNQVSVLEQSFEMIDFFPKNTEFWFRGFLPGPKLAAYLSRFFSEGKLGQLVLMKGPAWPKEKEEILNGKNIKLVWKERFLKAVELEYSLPKNFGQRILVLV